MSRLKRNKVLLFLASAFDYLDAPPHRVTGVDVPMPYANHLEQVSILNLFSYYCRVHRKSSSNGHIWSFSKVYKAEVSAVTLS